MTQTTIRRKEASGNLPEAIRTSGDPHPPEKAPGGEALSLFAHNRRLLTIAHQEELIGREQFTRIRETLETEIRSGTQRPVEILFKALQPDNAPRFEKVLGRKVYQYNAIIIKLAHQLAKNVVVQRARLEEGDDTDTSKLLADLGARFSEMTRRIGADFESGRQGNIDTVLLETGIIEGAHLEFLHGGVKHLEIKSLDRKFGQIAVENRIATPKVVNSALSEQTELFKSKRKNHIIGDILIRNREITTAQRDEILLIQNRVPEEDWEQALQSVARSALQEKEESARFGAIAIKRKLLTQQQVQEALRIQDEENRAFKNKEAAAGEKNRKKAKPRWIGKILTDDFGLRLSDKDRILKEQMKQRIAILNLKWGVNISRAQQELIDALDRYFGIEFDGARTGAHIRVLGQIPETVTRDDIILWLSGKKVTFGRIDQSIGLLLAGKVGKGVRIPIARARRPVPAKTAPQLFFDNTENPGDSASRLDHLVRKNKILATVSRTEGKPGMDVSGNPLRAPLSDSHSIRTGHNVRRSGNNYIATCDGLPEFSETGTLSVSGKIVIDGDIDREGSPAEFRCDFEIRGNLTGGVPLACRSLICKNLEGDAETSDACTVIGRATNALVRAGGVVTLGSVLGSRILCEKNIIIQASPPGESENRIENAELHSERACRIAKSSLAATVVRATGEILLDAVSVAGDCILVAGVSAQAIRLEEAIAAATQATSEKEQEIQAMREESAALYGKQGEKDLTRLNEKLAYLEAYTPVNLDLLKAIRMVKKEIRKREKVFETESAKKGDRFIEISRTIERCREEISGLKREIDENHLKIQALFEQDAGDYGIKLKGAIARGTVIRMRHTKKLFNKDLTVNRTVNFKEVRNLATGEWEIKMYHW